MTDQERAAKAIRDFYDGHPTSRARVSETFIDELVRDMADLCAAIRRETLEAAAGAAMMEMNRIAQIKGAAAQWAGAVSVTNVIGALAHRTVEVVTEQSVAGLTGSGTGEAERSER